MDEKKCHVQSSILMKKKGLYKLLNMKKLDLA